MTAVRVEAMPDDSLPHHGPGMVYYEGTAGDFFLSEFTVLSKGQPVKVSGAGQSTGSSAKLAIDGKPETAWALNGGGQNMSRACLTGALVGAEVGLSRLPKRFIDGLSDRQEILALADTIAVRAGSGSPTPPT